MEIEETAALDLLFDAMSTENIDGAIERSGKRGQSDFVKSYMLPINMATIGVPDKDRFQGITDDMDYSQREKIVNKNVLEYTQNQYLKMGIAILSQVDDLFYDVELPQGWKIQATDHSMWNDLLDNKGRKRASIFYKAAFYDRSAYVAFEKRYTHTIIPFDEYNDENVTYEQRKFKEWYSVVKDCGVEIWRSPALIPKTNQEYSLRNDKLKEACIEFLSSNFPNYEDIHAYWD